MTYSSEVLADTPALYFKMDDAGSPLVDSSGNGHNAALFDGSGTYHEPGPGSAFSVLTTSGAWKLASAGTFQVNQSHYTLECAVLWNGTSTLDTGVCGAWGGAAATGAMLYHDGNKIYGYHGATSFTDGVALSTTTWEHWVLNWDGTTIRWYRNSVLIHSASSSTPPGTSDHPFQISSYGNVASVSGRHFPGHLAYVAAYDTALSAARISAHFSALTDTSVSDVLKQNAQSYLYENVGFSVNNTHEAQGEIFENVGVNNPNFKEAIAEIYEGDVIVHRDASYWGKIPI